MLAPVGNVAILFACLRLASADMPKAPVDKWCPPGPICANCDCSSGATDLAGPCCCHPDSTAESPQACQMLLCKQTDPNNIASVHVLLYRTDPNNDNAKQIAAKGWFDPEHHAAATGSPFGGYFRRCLTSQELAAKKTCRSINLESYDEQLGYCVANSPASGIFGKGEKVPIESAMNANVGKIDEVFHAQTAFRQLKSYEITRDKAPAADDTYDKSVLLHRTPSETMAIQGEYNKHDTPGALMNERPQSWSTWVSSKAKRLTVILGSSARMLSVTGVFYVINADDTPLGRPTFRWSDQNIEWLSCDEATRKDKFFHAEAVAKAQICESAATEGGGGWWKIGGDVSTSKADGVGSNGQRGANRSDGGGAVGMSVVIGLSVGAILLLSFAAYSTYCRAVSGPSRRDVSVTHLTEMSATYMAD